MSRPRIRSFVASPRRLAIVLLVALVASGCVLPHDRVSRRIGRTVEDPAVTTLDLAALTDFSWDELVLFEPYQPRDRICRAAGVDVAACGRVVPFEARDDGVMTLIFFERGEVVHVARHLRRRGDFLPLAGADGAVTLSRARAVFAVQRDSDWIRLVQQSVVP